MNVYRKSKQEYYNKYDFIITKIEIDAKGYMTFSDSSNNIYCFTSYRFSKWDNLGITNGDKIFKKSNSREMILSRKESGGTKFKIYHIQEPNGQISLCFYTRSN